MQIGSFQKQVKPEWVKIWLESETVKKEMTKCFVTFSASEAERTIGFRQPGDPTVQTEVDHRPVYLFKPVLGVGFPLDRGHANK